jgi:anti-sigma B factor antagonist
MKLHEQKHGAVTVIRPEGPLVEEHAQTLKTNLLSAMKSSLGRVVVDLSAVPFVDSRGLETLVDLTEEMGKGGQALKLCAPNKTVREVLELTALVSMFDHFDDLNSAVRSFL